MLGENQQQLLAAIAVGPISFAGVAVDERGDLAQRTVAGLMTVVVVVLLETVKVAQHQRVAVVIAFRPGWAIYERPLALRARLATGVPLSWKTK